MIDHKEIYETLVKEWRSDFGDRGLPLEMSNPTLKTFLANERPYSNDYLLCGTIENIARLSDDDSEQNTLNYRGDVSDELTTLEKACGLRSTPRHEILIARVAAYMSMQTKKETSCVAVSLFMKMISSGEIDSEPSHEQKMYQSLQNALFSIMDHDAEYFFALYVSFSFQGVAIHPQGDPRMLFCLHSWMKYSTWRHEKEQNK